MSNIDFLNDGDSGLQARTIINALVTEVNNGAGTSGTSGSSGGTGSSGTSGTSGNNGTSGSSGSSGTSGLGTSGSSGTSGISGVDGTSGVAGISGVNGIPGTSGSSGSSGTSGDGTSGTSGIGTHGTSGTSGVNGTSGTSGVNGTSGINGTSGTSGEEGTSGTSGSSGGGFNFIGGWLSTDPYGENDVVKYGNPYRIYIATENVSIGEDDPSINPKWTLMIMSGTSGTSGDGTGGSSGTSGVGVPTGGTSGQVLSKVDGTDYNTQWVDVAASGSAFPYTGTAGISGSVAIDGYLKVGTNDSYSTSNILSGDQNKTYGNNSAVFGSLNILGTPGAYIADRIEAGTVILSSTYGNVTFDFKGSNIDYARGPFAVYLDDSMYDQAITPGTYTITDAVFVDGTNTHLFLSDTSIDTDGYECTVISAEYPSTGNTIYGGDNASQQFSAGQYNYAIAKNTVALGKYNLALGDGSIATGESTRALGKSSQTVGYRTRAYGDYSLAAGDSTISNTKQTVVGLYNLPIDTEGAFVIGNGASNFRRNLLEAVDQTVTFNPNSGRAVRIKGTNGTINFEDVPWGDVGTGGPGTGTPPTGLDSGDVWLDPTGDANILRVYF